VGHFVISAAQLEAEYRLQVFSFQQDLAAHSRTQVGGMCEGSLGNDFVDARSEYESQVLRAGQTQLNEARPYQGFGTSGNPFGSRNSSGTACWAFCFGFSEGGDGLAVYSVRERPLDSGVLGVCTPL